jgi:hypothetical protein
VRLLDQVGHQGLAFEHESAHRNGHDEIIASLAVPEVAFAVASGPGPAMGTAFDVDETGHGGIGREDDIAATPSLASDRLAARLPPLAFESGYAGATVTAARKQACLIDEHGGLG